MQTNDGGVTIKEGDGVPADERPSRSVRDHMQSHPNRLSAEFLSHPAFVLDFSEVAEGVLWLVSERARLVTGLALPMDAGWIAKRGG